MVGRGADLGDLALGSRGQLVSLPPRGGLDRVRFPLSGSAQVIGFPLGARPQFRGLILGRSSQFGGVRFGRGLQLVDGGSGLTEDLGGLLLGKPQQLLDPEPTTRMGRALALP